MGQREYSRSVRVAEQIQREIALLLAHEVADPRIGEVTVSGVDLSPDMRRARVLITPGRSTDGDAAAVALNRAAGFLRSRLGARLRLRYLPRLEFAHDLTLERALRIDSLLEGAERSPPSVKEGRSVS
ncbi:MAG: 30S ribosome-binding factor RbfA [Ectothiorhodospiraceae bacterium AqS1]|nr:30S ribosome-binding factor RbfA [Ectothiorhodospiraceae bacterium AqS1]